MEGKGTETKEKDCLCEDRPFLERTFEKALWASRLLVLIAVIPSLCASFALFIIGTNKIFKVFVKTMENFMDYDANYYKYAIGNIITAVDIYLIATVMIIFSLGLYELYVSKLEPAEVSDNVKILNIKSLEDLKTKLAKVVLMVLIVTFFKYAQRVAYSTPMDLLVFGGAILTIALTVYFTGKHAK
ncbi:YqhA family protein [Desulfurobacterium atlanticum]|uniref:Uncharacterized membrane protein YqhA n=1 Tax=Desulfurobacterium atlanticum TaxID=240169 RepID=A0A238ZQF9_9BACT|nr:YqhA family protein [Desulfurobacterium atlanticum]SNR85637.1 Uncharacterized membrane protein YqhA [Desulfurobacterium atlanticum]